MKKWEKWQVNGMPGIIFFAACIITIIALYSGSLASNIVTAFAICFSIGILIVWLGDRIPIWKTFCGGGILLAMFGGASGKYFGWLPDTTVDLITDFIGNWNFLEFFIMVLLVGSILAVNKKILIRSVTRYIPCILAGVVASAVLACIVGFIFGKNIPYTLSYFVLPIMSGGSGAGALPLAEMFNTTTGLDYNEYVSIAMSTLTIGDLFAVLTATILGKVVEGNKKLCGDGQLMRGSGDDKDSPSEEVLPKPTMQDLANCFVILFSIYAISCIFSTIVLPSIAGAAIHKFAYAVIFTVIVKVSGILPDNITAALVWLQKYFALAFSVIAMFCCGVAYTDLGTVLDCLTQPATVFICLAVVIGAVLGAAFCGRLVGFYPYEAGVTAGLCMANAGGAGDVSVLSACKRMNLMSYAQISSRIGNAIILIIGSFIFAYLF